MQFGANCPVKFWPCTFHHWLLICNAIPSWDWTQFPLKIALSKVDDFSNFWTFRSQVWFNLELSEVQNFAINLKEVSFLVSFHIPPPTFFGVTWKLIVSKLQSMLALMKALMIFLLLTSCQISFAYSADNLVSKYHMTIMKSMHLLLMLGCLHSSKQSPKNFMFLEIKIVLV